MHRIIAVLSVALFMNVQDSAGHGRMMDPVNRSSAWRLKYGTPINYDDDGLYCGGISVQWGKNKGKCGPCGDNYAQKQPRSNENGGYYGTGLIVKKYRKGQKIDLVVHLTTSHLGYMDFSVCRLNSTKDIETEECFEANPLPLNNGKYKFKIPPPEGHSGYYSVTGQLPKNLTCKHCVIRWNYRAGNNWGICENGHGGMGCGEQETFRGCADVSIADDSENEIGDEDTTTENNASNETESTTLEITTDYEDLTVRNDIESETAEHTTAKEDTTSKTPNPNTNSVDSDYESWYEEDDEDKNNF